MKTNTVRQVKEIITKPSEALQHMVDGLKKQSKRRNFIIDMGTYGEPRKDGKFCAGCAATCAIQNVFGVNLTPTTIDAFDNVRASKLKGETIDLDNFESAINGARLGELMGLFSYFNLTQRWKDTYDNRFHLYTHNWEEQLPLVEKLIKLLKNRNL